MGIANITLSGMVADLMATVATMRGDIDGLVAKVDSCARRVEYFEASITGLAIRANDHAKRIAELERRMDAEDTFTGTWPLVLESTGPTRIGTDGVAAPTPAYPPGTGPLLPGDAILMSKPAPIMTHEGECRTKPERLLTVRQVLEALRGACDGKNCGTCALDAENCMMIEEVLMGWDDKTVAAACAIVEAHYAAKDASK